MSLLDLLVLIGFYVDYLSTSGAKQGLTAVRLFRLLSIFRFERQSKGLKHLGQVLKRKIPELILALFVAIILLVTSATLMYAVENEFPEFSSLSKALWWSAMTITTVGYGDVSPNTGAGRIIASVVAFMGLCLFALPSAVLGSGLIEVMTENRHAAFLERKRARKSRRSRRSLYQAQRRDSYASVEGGDEEIKSSSFGTGSEGGGEMKGVEMSKFIDKNTTRSMSMDSSDDSPRHSSKNGVGLLFSDIFDVRNPQHLMAVSALLTDEPNAYSFFQRFQTEPGGLIGLHALVTQRLAEAYLHEHLEEEEDEEEMLESGGGGGGQYLSVQTSRNTHEDQKFMKL